MKRLLRLLKYASYGFLALSVILLGGLVVGSAFVTDFTIENRTPHTIVVTPIGTSGPEGYRRPLPVVILAFPCLPALRAGEFTLLPGQAITIRYDMDDVNFSEIVVKDEHGHQLQLVTDPDPTKHQYRAPLQRHHVIDDLSQLDEVPPELQRATEAARKTWVVTSTLYVLMFGPWIVYGVGCLRHRPAVCNPNCPATTTPKP